MDKEYIVTVDIESVQVKVTAHNEWEAEEKALELVLNEPEQFVSHVTASDVYEEEE